MEADATSRPVWWMLMGVLLGGVVSRLQQRRSRVQLTFGDGEIRDKSIRYLLIRPDSIMSIFTELAEMQDIGTAEKALKAFEASVCKAGTKSFNEYMRRLQSGYEAAHLEGLVFATAAKLGWGLWTSTVVNSQEIHVGVQNSPFVIEGDVQICGQSAPIVGILTALYTCTHCKSNQGDSSRKIVVSEIPCNTNLTIDGVLHFRVLVV
jgi:hypothetical protein